MSIIRDLFTAKVNSTMMTINDRFTYLQKNMRPAQTTVMTIRANNAAQQQASAKNRRLAMQMERRLSAMAALKIKKKSIRQRLGIPAGGIRQGSVRDRLSLPVRGRGRGRGRGRTRGNPLRRTQSTQSLQSGNLQRSRSLQSLNEVGVPGGRSRSRSRTRAQTPNRRRSRSRSRRRSNSNVRQNDPNQRKGLVGPQRRFSTGSFNQQQVGNPQRRRRSASVNRGTRGIRNQRGQTKATFRRGAGGNFQQNRPFRQQKGRRGGGGGPTGNRGFGRNRFGGRGGRRGGGRNQANKVVPSKEELDKQLDQYMANTKSHLDKELDSYMEESGANEVWD